MFWIVYICPKLVLGTMIITKNTRLYDPANIRRKAVIGSPELAGHRVFDTVFPVCNYIDRDPKQSRVRDSV